MAAIVRTISITCAVALLASCNGPEGWPQKKFDSLTWSKTPDVERYVLVHDLIAGGVLQGKNAEEVKAVLGTPSFEDADEHYLSYVVRSGGIGFNQVHVLDIRFDTSTGRVSRATIRGD